MRTDNAKRWDAYRACLHGIAGFGLLLAVAGETPLHQMLALTAAFLLAVLAWGIAPTPATRSVAWFLAMMTTGFVWIVAATPAAAEHVPTYRSRYDPDHGGRRLVVRQTRKVWRHESIDSRCRAPLAVVGDQYATIEGAKQEADKAWMQTARWAHGERFMDRANAEDATYECGRSSIGSVVGQTFSRCRLIARPCPPDRSKEDR